MAELTDFERLVKEMRAMQRAYFRTREPHPLLAIGERHYCKLCTLAWRKAIENWRKS